MANYGLIISCMYGFGGDIESASKRANIEAIKCVFDSGDIPYVVLQNPKKVSEIKAAMRKAFRKAKKNDTCYLYIHAHGETTSYYGHEILLLPSVNRMRAKKLRKLLDGFKGDKVVLYESCHSGDVIGVTERIVKSKGLTEEASTFMAAFDEEEEKPRIFPILAASKSCELVGKRYYVACSSVGSKVSWMVKDYRSPFGKLTGGVFTYAIARSFGYDMIYDITCERCVTFGEIEKTVHQIADTITEHMVKSYGEQYVNHVAIRFPNEHKRVF